jgi:hypothetical protein
MLDLCKQKNSMITKTKFFRDHGHRLVKIAEDSADSGDIMLFHPEEKWTAADYILEGYEIASVYEMPDEDEDVVEINNDVSEHPYKFGYLVLRQND